MDIVDELANELRHYRHSQMGSGALAEHILAIPRIHDALEAHSVIAGKVAELTEALRSASKALWILVDVAEDTELPGLAETLRERAEEIDAALAPYPERRSE